MAGTYMIGEVKVRPGTYFNVQKAGGNSLAGTINGYAAILFRSDWGPLGKAVEITVDDGYEKVYGTGLTTDAIALAFEGGTKTAICCRIGNGGTQGNVKLKLSDKSEDAVTIAAKHVGSKEFTVTVKDKLSDESKRECIIYSGTKEFEKVSFEKGGNEVAAVISAFSASTNFKVTQVGSATGALASITQAKFEAGTNPTSTTEDYSNGFVAIESHYFNTVCVDTEDAAVHGLLDSFLERIFNAGQLAIGVIAEKGTVTLEDRMAHAVAFNSEKMVYVVNASATSSSFGSITGYQVAAKVSGMVAACASNRSLTHTVLDGITQLDDVLTPTQMTKAETMGCLVLSVNASKQVWIDSAINTLVTPNDDQDDGWKKIRRTKTRYELITRANNQADALIGKVDNDTNGRATIVSQIQGIGSKMVEEGKLISCTVTESAIYTADGDSAWFDIDCVDKDSAEHIYLTYTFRFSTQG